MKIRDMISFYDAQIREVGKRKFTAEKMLDALATPINCGKQADDACSYFARNKEWEELDDDTACEVCLRLACARWYCDTPHFAGVDDETNDIYDQIEDMLIAYWNDTGKEDWIIEGILGLKGE
jgi:hypothetical protein